MNKNARVAAICAVAVVAMVGAAFAAVPLYRLFCQVTGFDGTVMKADKAPTEILDRPMKIRFDANVRDLPWEFKAEQVTQELKVGETGLAFFKVTNKGDKPISGTAAYNVVPESAGAYFQKLECFCFEAQTLQPGQTMEFPVAYFVDPGLVSDAETKGIQEITLSYTFYPTEKPQTEASAGTPGLGGAG